MKCKLCSHVLKESKILPCLHMFCLKCLETLERTLIGAEIQCPICCNQSQIPFGSVKNFPNTVFIAKLDCPEYEEIEIVLTKNVCAICEANNISLLLYCLQCHQVLCNQCGNAHTKLKIAENHQLSKISKIYFKKPLSKKKYEFCKDHYDSYLESYCDFCKLIVCSLCYAENHQHSNTKNFAVFSRQINMELEKNINTIKDKIFNCELQLKTLENQESKCFSDVHIISKEIDRKSSELVQLIKKNKKALHEKLVKIQEQEIKRISDLSANLKEKIENLKIMMVKCNDKVANPTYESNFIKEYKFGTKDYSDNKADDLTVKEHFLNYINCDINYFAELYIEHFLGDVIETKDSNPLLMMRCDKCNVPRHTFNIAESETLLGFVTSKLDDLIITQK